MDRLTTWMSACCDALWTYALIALLVACGLWFTWRTRGVQFRMVGHMLRLLGESAIQSGELPASEKKRRQSVSSFQAFAVSIATRVGTGNLAGVAIAIATGGPGAVFWMWVIALLGASTAFVESTLAQLFKQRGKDSFVGGPAYYILHGLRCRWMSVLFAVLITLTFGLSYNSVQANTICQALDQAFGWQPWVVGIVLSLLSLLIVFGGIHRVSRVSSVLVPLMAVGYLLLALVVVGIHWRMIPHVFRLIVESAFGIRQVAGGSVGMALIIGMRRGLFSNEAGEGSAPNVAATATVSHPVKQGLIQALGVFTDTLLVCSCTAFIILLSGVQTVGEADGIRLTQVALSATIGPAGEVFVAVAIFLFAFSSIIGNYYYGETNIRFLTPSPAVMCIYRLFSGGVMVMLGALMSLELVWGFGDLCMALITACNLAAVIPLSRYVFTLLRHYQQQRREGKNPVFHREDLPEVAERLSYW